jgi:hypothetical protein
VARPDLWNTGVLGLGSKISCNNDFTQSPAIEWPTYLPTTLLLQRSEHSSENNTELIMAFHLKNLLTCGFQWASSFTAHHFLLADFTAY